MIIFFLLGWNEEFDNENIIASEQEKELSINTWKRETNIDYVSKDLQTMY